MTKSKIDEILSDDTSCPECGNKIKSVSLEWLNDFCHQHGYYSQKTFVINLTKLLPAAELQASEKTK